MLKNLHEIYSPAFVSFGAERSPVMDSRELLEQEIADPGRFFPILGLDRLLTQPPFRPCNYCMLHDLGLHRDRLKETMCRLDPSLLFFCLTQEYEYPANNLRLGKDSKFFDLLLENASLGHFDLVTKYDALISDAERDYTAQKGRLGNDPSRFFELIYLEKISHGVTSMPGFSEVKASCMNLLRFIPSYEEDLMAYQDRAVDKPEMLSGSLMLYLSAISGMKFFASETPYTPKPEIYEAIRKILTRLDLAQSDDLVSQGLLFFGLKSLFSSGVKIDGDDFVWTPLPKEATPSFETCVFAPVIDVS